MSSLASQGKLADLTNKFDGKTPGRCKEFNSSAVSPSYLSISFALPQLEFTFWTIAVKYFSRSGQQPSRILYNNACKNAEWWIPP
jgi:hypothetical protein